jgi:predicted transcriptional regulator
MRRSRIEMYVDILKVLTHHGPLKLTHILYKAHVNGSILKEYLGFLIKQNLVEERNVGKSTTVFAITQKGITALINFRELQQIFPIIEETRNMTPTPI